LKKEPKNFCTLARALRLARTAMIKSFLFLFFKKEVLAFPFPHVRPAVIPASVEVDCPTPRSTGP
jgi:hypothetical protein